MAQQAQKQSASARNNARSFNGKNGKPRNARAGPAWKSSLHAYAEKQRLVFLTEEDLEAAIDLLWTAPLRSLPHDTPDGRSVVIPSEAVSYFSEAGLRFTAKPLRSVSDLTVEEIKSTRR